jgi:hypothetical protein
MIINELRITKLNINNILILLSVVPSSMRGMRQYIEDKNALDAVEILSNEMEMKIGNCMTTLIEISALIEFTLAHATNLPNKLKEEKDNPL